MVAHLSSLCGVYLGPKEWLLGPDQGNPEGHFEHKRFIEINNTILSIFGGSSDDPPDLPRAWENDPRLEPVFYEAACLFATFNQGYPWGWKDPRTALVIPFWRKLCPTLRFIVCLRNPLEVARSLARRDAMPMQRSLYLWYRYTRSAIRDTVGCPRIFVFYEDFFEQAAHELIRLVKFCGLSSPLETSTILAGVSLDLRRNVVTQSDLLMDQTATPVQKLLYLSARALSLERFPMSMTISEREAAISDSINGLAIVLDQLHSEEKVIELQTSLVKKDLTLTQLAQEVNILRTRMATIEHSLAWQVMQRLNSTKEKYLPAGTCRRNFYDWLLIRLKKANRD